MNEFDKKWRVLVSRARKAAPRDETAPLGFPTRAFARARQAAESYGTEIWGSLTLRALGLALPVLVICASLELPHLRGAPPLESGVQDTVAQILWRL